MKHFALLLALVARTSGQDYAPLESIECDRNSAADLLLFTLASGANFLWEPPSPKASCEDLDRPINVNWKFPGDALQGCRIAQLTAIAFAIVLELVKGGDADVGKHIVALDMLDGWPLAKDGPELLHMFGSRFPVFSLLAWAQFFFWCRRTASPRHSCHDVEKPDADGDGAVDRKTYWPWAMKTAERVSSMLTDVTWTNGARFAFDATILQQDAKESCPLGVSAAMVVRGIYKGWGFEEWDLAPNMAGIIADTLAASTIGVRAVLESPWPLFTLAWQLEQHIDHTFSALRGARWLRQAIHRSPLVSYGAEDQCESTLPAPIVVGVTDAQATYLKEWISMVRGAHYAGFIIIVARPIAWSVCEALLLADHGLPMACYTGTSKSMEAERISAALAALETTRSVFMLEFDILMLTNPFTKIKEIMCEYDQQTRPSWFVDRPDGLDNDIPYFAALRYMRGWIGMSVMREAFFKIELNPFYRPIAYMALMKVQKPFDVALPTSTFAHADRVTAPHAVSIFSPASPWLAELYRPLLFAAKPHRPVVRQKLCRLKLLPRCEDPIDGAAWNESRPWAQHFVSQFQFTADESIFSMRPRVFQIGPSGCGTTSIAGFFAAHGLATAKAYNRQRHIHSWIIQALSEGRSALHHIDFFDAYTDFLDPISSTIPSCSADCTKRGESIKRKIRGYLTIVTYLKEQYPYSKFVYNMRSMQNWLATRVHSCWPWVDKKGSFAKWLNVWTGCCGVKWEPKGNPECWKDPRLTVPWQPAEGQTPEEWAYEACCVPLTHYQYVWHEMYNGILQVFPKDNGNGVFEDRMLIFKIDGGDSRPLSDFLGVKHRESAWKRSHAHVVEKLKKTTEKPGVMD